MGWGSEMPLGPVDTSRSMNRLFLIDYVVNLRLPKKGGPTFPSRGRFHNKVSLQAQIDSMNPKNSARFFGKSFGGHFGFTRQVKILHAFLATVSPLPVPSEGGWMKHHLVNAVGWGLCLVPDGSGGSGKTRTCHQPARGRAAPSDPGWT